MNTELSDRWPTAFSPHGPVAKGLTILYAICAIVAIYCVLRSYDYGFEQARSVYANIARTLSFAALIIITLCLSTFIQKDAYWWNLNAYRKGKLDERQREVRHRIFERSYRFSVYVVVIFVILTLFNMDAINTLAHNSLPSSDDIYWVPSIVLLNLLYGMPSFIAAWERDS